MAEFAIDVKVNPAQASRNLGKVDKDLNKVGKSASKVKTLMGTLFAGLTAAVAVSQLRTLSDEFVTLQNRLRVVSGSLQQVNASASNLFKIANNARVPVADLTTLFQRASISSKELGANQQQLLQFTDGVAKALAVQGGSVQSARGALIQLSQAIGGTIVRAEEFNSIQEGALPILQAVAEGIDRAGGSVAKLRNLVISGQITSKEFFNAFLSQVDNLDEKFQKTIPTISQAFSVLNNNLIRFVGGSDAVQSVSSAVAKAIIELAGSVDKLKDNFILLAKAATTLLLIKLTPYMTAFFTATRASVAEVIRLEIALGAGSKAAAVFSASLKAATRAAKALGRVLLVGAVVEGIFFAIEKFNEFNDIIKKGTISWGDLAVVGIDKFVNAVVNGFVGLGRVIAASFKSQANLVLTFFSELGRQAIAVFSGVFTAEEALGNLNTSMNSAFSGMFTNITNVFKDQFNQRLVEIASGDQIKRVASALSGAGGAAAGGDDTIAGEVSVTAARPSAITRFETGFSDQFSEMSSQIGTLGDQFSRLGGQVAEIFGPGGTLSTGIGDAVAGAILFGDSFTDSLKEIGKQILAQIISGLVQIGVNMLINKTLGSALLAATVAETGAAAGALGAAWATPAALASLATLGTNSAAAIGALATTTAVSQGLAAVGGFRDGGYTGNSGVNSVAGVVHGQEYVFDAEATKRIGVSNLEAIRRGNVSSAPSSTARSGASVGKVNEINIYGDVTQDTINDLEDRMNRWAQENTRTGGFLEKLA